MPALALEDISAGYPGRPVLAGISATFAPGEVTVLLGRNGAGKSTVLRVAGAMLRPSAGRVRIGDVELGSLAPRARARLVASVGQEETLEFPFTVRQLAAIGRFSWRGTLGRPTSEDDAAVERALAALDLVALAERPVPELSGGERRRAFLARALAQEAAVLLLDEPTAHLDVGHEAALLGVVRAIARERGAAVVLALHDLNLVGLVADRVVILDGGRVRAAGPVGEVFDAEILSAAFGTPLEIVARPGGGAPLAVPRGAR